MSRKTRAGEAEEAGAAAVAAKLSMVDQWMVVWGAGEAGAATVAAGHSRRGCGPAAGRSARGAAAAVAVACALGAGSAQAQQSVTLSAGRFAVKGFDSRIDRDVLLENLSVFDFRLDDFRGGSAGGSWDLALGDHFEVSLGLGYYQRTVPSVYADYVDFDGSEIVQDFRLRIVPGTATIRFLPFGDAPVRPYFGGGVGVYAWRYAEFGEFIDFGDLDRFGTYSTFEDRFVARGTDAGGVLLGGVRFPFGDRYAFGLEVQYHEARGVVDVDNGFLEDEIDLGGLTTQVTFRVGF